MGTGLPLSYKEDSNKITNKILTLPLEFSHSTFIIAKDVVNNLLNRRPGQRLGAHVGASETKNHSFFNITA